jgi:hypothetical protein
MLRQGRGNSSQVTARNLNIQLILTNPAGFPVRMIISRDLVLATRHDFPQCSGAWELLLALELRSALVPITVESAAAMAISARVASRTVLRIGQQKVWQRFGSMQYREQEHARQPARPAAGLFFDRPGQAATGHRLRARPGLGSQSLCRRVAASRGEKFAFERSGRGNQGGVLLFAVTPGILYFSKSRAPLVEARGQSLIVQACTNL